MSREESNEATNKVGPQSIYLSISADHKRQKKKRNSNVSSLELLDWTGLDWTGLDGKTKK